MTAGRFGTQLDVLVIGGGQAGLAMGYQLAQRDLRVLIVDSGPEIGHVWRSRWDSLRLFTSGRYDNLPGLPFPTAADTYPGKDEVADYLRAYAAAFELPVRLDTMVTSLARAGNGRPGRLSYWAGVNSRSESQRDRHAAPTSRAASTMRKRCPRCASW